ncbi:MAG: hypothetical protein KGH63_05070, partial [Candidatus Micrarchaeota archaeon]|nr:hypothetical protein [Candidatus Micrarchaeota archaeon]
MASRFASTQPSGTRPREDEGGLLIAQLTPVRSKKGANALGTPVKKPAATENQQVQRTEEQKEELHRKAIDRGVTNSLVTSQTTPLAPVGQPETHEWSGLPVQVTDAAGNLMQWKEIDSSTGRYKLSDWPLYLDGEAYSHSGSETHHEPVPTQFIYRDVEETFQLLKDRIKQELDQVGPLAQELANKFLGEALGTGSAPLDDPQLQDRLDSKMQTYLQSQIDAYRQTLDAAKGKDA